MKENYKLSELSEDEMNQVRSCEDIKLLVTEHHPIHNTHQTDDFGNEIAPQKYTYNILIEIEPSTKERESKVEEFISSLTLPSKDHGVDKFSKEYNDLLIELGIRKKKMPSTLGEALEDNPFERITSRIIAHDK